ncbi:GTP 3',8-cyclase MoaA, partial [Rhizobium ruizarguesonis]
MNTRVGTIGNASPLVAGAHHMIDHFGRSVTYLRVSVTDRCDFRCT